MAAIQITEPSPGHIQCDLEGIDAVLPETSELGGPEFMALPVAQRFAVVLHEALKQTDLGKMIMSRCGVAPQTAQSGPKYPCRCRIIDPEGEEVYNDGENTLVAKTPDVSVPKLGRHGTAYLEPDGNVRIKLDDGSELMGYECWWEPIADVN